MKSKNRRLLSVDGPRGDDDDAEPPRINPTASRQAPQGRRRATMMSGRKDRGPKPHPHPRHDDGYCDSGGSINRHHALRIRTAEGSIRLGTRSGAVAVAAAASWYLLPSVIVVAATWTSLPNAAPVAEVAGCRRLWKPPPPSLLGVPTGTPPTGPGLGAPARSLNRRRRGHRADGAPVFLCRGGGGGDGGDDASLRPPPPPSSVAADVNVDASIAAVGGEGEEAPAMTTTTASVTGRTGAVDPESLPDEGWGAAGAPWGRTSGLLTTPHRWMPAVSIAPREVVVGDRDGDGDGGDDSSGTTAVATMATAEPVLVTKFELAGRLGCPLRDLRIVDPKYGGAAAAAVGAGPSETHPARAFGAEGRRHSNTAFLPRRGGVVVHVGAARAVVMEREVLLFGPRPPSPSPTAPIAVGADTSTDVDVDGLVGFLLDHLNAVFGEDGNVAEPREGGGGRKGRRGRRAAAKSSLQQPSQRQAHDYRKRARLSPGEERSPPAPFELVVIEAILSYVCTEEAERAAAVIAASREVLDGIEGGRIGGSDAGGSRWRKKRAKKASFMSMQSHLGRLLPLKNRLDELEASCAEVASAIVDVLRSDEDMEAMIPSRRRGRADGAGGGADGRQHSDPQPAHGRANSPAGQPARSGNPSPAQQQHRHHHHDRRAAPIPPHVPPVDGHAEVELLFEDFLLQMEEVLYSLRSVQSGVRNTEEVVEIELDLMRNRILRYELLLESSSLAVGCGAAITGLFGMNLVSRYEEHVNMFYYVTAFIVVLIAGIGFGIVSQLEIDNIW